MLKIIILAIVVGLALGMVGYKIITLIALQQLTKFKALLSNADSDSTQRTIQLVKDLIDLHDRYKSISYKEAVKDKEKCKELVNIMWPMIIKWTILVAENEGQMPEQLQGIFEENVEELEKYKQNFLSLIVLQNMHEQGMSVDVDSAENSDEVLKYKVTGKRSDTIKAGGDALW